MTDDWSSSDFDWLDWDALTSQGKFEGQQIARAVTDLRSTIPEADARRLATLELLLDVLSVYIAWQSQASSPLQPEHIITRLPKSALTALVTHVSRIASAELRSRILDLAWLKRACTYVEAGKAVDAYLEDFELRFDPKAWTKCFARLQRAVDLSASLGRSSDHHRRALDLVKAKLTALDGTDPLYLSARMMELLLKYQRGDASVYAPLCSKIAERATSQCYFDRAVTYLEIEARWWNDAKDESQASDTRMRIARTLEAKALAFEPRMRAHFLPDAIEAYRQHPHGKADAERLRVQLQATQREAMQSLPLQELFSTDVSDCVSQAREKVTGKNALDALVALCGLYRVQPLDEIRTAVRKQLEETRFSAFLPQVYLSAAGRMIHQSDVVADGSEAFIDSMRRHVAFHQNFVVQAGFLPAIDTVRREHGLRFEDFFYLAERSPFVPPQRAYSFARGLTAGFYGEFDIAAHLLVPQLENAIRVVLEKSGAITTTLSPSGTQKERDLNQLLLDPIAVQVFGEPLVFDLQTLLTEKPGTNLRNELAHGLLDDGQRLAFVYCWWIVLRLVLSPLLPANDSPDLSPAPKGDSAYPKPSQQETSTSESGGESV